MSNDATNKAGKTRVHSAEREQSLHFSRSQIRGEKSAKSDSFRPRRTTKNKRDSHCIFYRRLH
jgi:hypothetical protein